MTYYWQGGITIFPKNKQGFAILRLAESHFVEWCGNDQVLLIWQYLDVLWLATAKLKLPHFRLQHVRMFRRVFRCMQTPRCLQIPRNTPL
jgi:hypothetical protein